MQEQNQDPLVEEALRWLVVLRDKAASDADRAAFERWLKADSRHEAAWARARQVWMRVGKIGPAFANRVPAEVTAPPLAAPVAVRSTAPPLAAPVAVRSTAPRVKTVGRRRFLYGAAAVTAVAAPAGLLLSQPGLFADHGTGVGERRTIALEDGSTVELAGASSLSVDFGVEARRLVLHAGQAFFDVARDRARPFIVEAAGGQTQALGTAFDVKRQGDDVTVTVAEHAVAVSTADGKAIVGEGQQVRYGPRRLGAVRDADLGQAEAWRRDRLIFHETPLGEVIADLERYRGGRIVVTDGRLRGIPVTAVFDAREADAALDTIAGSLPIRLRRLTGLLVVLSPRA